MIPSRDQTAPTIEIIAESLRSRGHEVRPSDFGMWWLNGSEVTAAQLAYVESEEQ